MDKNRKCVDSHNGRGEGEDKEKVYTTTNKIWQTREYR